MTDTHPSRRFIWALLLLFCIAWFYALGARTLVPTDEGRYAEMAREMVVSGDWITPRLNGIKYFEKPPLQIWMNALTFKLFGLGEWQARLWTGLCGLFGIALVAHTGRRVFDARTGLVAGLVLASSFWWAAFGHVNTLDMGLAGMMTLALCSLLIAQRTDASEGERRNWMLACWAGMALAVLSKGLIGVVLPGAVLVLYTLWSRDWAVWKRLHLGLGLLVFFAVTTPWFVLVSLKNPEFPQFFFIHEHLQRFTSKVHHREGPLYYFIPLLVIGIIPWLGMLAQSVWQARSERARGFQPKKMLLVWAVFIFFFFSISGSKLPSYILPIFPALALLIACHLEHLSRKAWIINAGLIATMGVAGLVFGPGIARFTNDPLEIPHYQAAQPWIMAASTIALAGGLILIWKIFRQPDTSRTRLAVVTAVIGFAIGQMLMLGSEEQGKHRSGLPMVPAIAAELTPGTQLYVVGMYDQTLPFYLRRTMTLVEHADELEFGLSQEPHLWLPTRAAFIEQWRKGPKAVAITRHAIFEDLERRGVPMRIITRDSRRIAITNDLKN